MKIFGRHLIEDGAVTQLQNCLDRGSIAVLTADAHLGYGHPVGGAIAYRDKISVSGVGYDIGCGNKAARTDMKLDDIESLSDVMDNIYDNIGFGVGRRNEENVDHPLFDEISDFVEHNLAASRSYKNKLINKAVDQLGTIGGGNHYVDLLVDDEGYIWVGVHFGSRGFGHRLTRSFLSAEQGKHFEDNPSQKDVFDDPVLLHIKSSLGQDYIESVKLAGKYAYAGRDWVVDRVVEILGNPKVTYEVHNHHNFAWRERHFGKDYWVVRKGCTPAFPGQEGFVGASMFDDAAIIEGVDSENAREGLYSTVHGAGRVLSRNQAVGKTKYKKDDNGQRYRLLLERGEVNFNNTIKRAIEYGVELRGAGPDESPECYKPLDEVLKASGDTIRVKRRLTPIGVAMAPSDIVDPYAKDDE